MFSRKNKESSQQNTQNQIDQVSLIKEQKELIKRDAEQRIELYQIDKCFNFCVKSFMEKLFSPYEKECMKTCLQNMQGFKIEVNNALEEF